MYPAHAEILRRWSDYVAEAPDELTSIAFVMKAPPAPFIPTDQVGQPVIIVAMVCLGDLVDAQNIVAPLRRLGTPIADITAPMPYPAMFALTAEATHPAPAMHRVGFMPAFDDASAELIVEQARRIPAPGAIIEVRGLGGRLARVDPASTAFAHRDKPYLLTLIGSTPDPAQMDLQRVWTAETWAILRPYTRGAYVGFLEDNGPAGVAEAYPAATYARLTAVKRQYDPSNVFRLNQNIP